MVLLGGLILENPANAMRFPEAVELFHRAAMLGNSDAEYNLGVCLRRGLGIEQDADAAERIYRAAAEQNNISAQLALGDLIAERATTEDEWLEAANWYRLAADNGHASAPARLVEIKKKQHPDVTEKAIS
jgi:TPR repeat protein